MSADPRNEESQPASVAIPKRGIIMRARRFLFGDDIFISYSRRDGSEYALALANELAKQKLSCYLDQFGTPPGKEMPRELISSLEMSTLLVLIGSEGAAASVNVGKEIEQFLRTGRGRRGIIPITFAEPEALEKVKGGSTQEDFEHTLIKAEWYSTIQGAALTVESNESLRNKQPSDKAVTRIINAEGFNSRNKRLRQVFRVSLIALIALLATSAVSLWVLSGKAASAEASARKAQGELAAAEERIQGSKDQLASLQTELDKGQEELRRTTTNLTKAQKEAEIAKDASERAKRQQQLSEERAADAREQQTLAEQQTRRATAERLAVDARRSMNERPQRSLLLAVQAVKATQRDDARVPVAEEALRHALAQSGGHVLRGHESAVDGVAISPNNRWLVSANGTDSRLWDNAAKGSAAGMYDLQGAGNPVAFSADNRWLFTGSGKKDGKYSEFKGEDNTGRLYDLSATDPTSRFLVMRGHDRPITSVAISPDVHWLVTASGGHEVRLWNLRAADPSAKPIALPGGGNSVTVIAISPDSHWLVTSSWDPEANRGETAATYLWNLTAENPVSSQLELKGHNSSVSDVVFSSDSHWLATRSRERDTHTFRQDGTVRVWSLADPAAAPRVLGTNDEQIKDMRFSPDSRLLVTGSQRRSNSASDSRIESSIKIWDLAHPDKRPEVLPGQEGAIIKVTFSPNSRWVAAVTGDHETNRPENGIITYLWELTSGARQPIVVRDSELEASQKFVEVSPDSHWLITGNSGHNARVWDLTDPKARPRVLRGHEGSISSIAFSPDNYRAITGSDDKTARLWNLTGASSVASPLVLPGESDCMFAISSDNHWLVTTRREESSYPYVSVALVWNLRDDDPAASPIILKGHTSHIGAVAISSDNRWVVTGSSDNTARLWDLAAPDPSANSIALTGHKSTVNEVAFSPDRRWVVTGSFDGTARVWNLAAPNVALDYVELTDGQESVEGKSKAIFKVDISPDSRWLITSGNENTLARLWDLSRLDKRDPAACSTVLDLVSRFAISPDSRWLILVKNDKTIRVCNLADSDPVAMSRDLRTEAGPFLQNGSSPFVISPDSHWLATSSDDDVAHIWELTTTDSALKSRVMRGTEGPITGIAFSRDNHWLVIGGSIAGSYNTLCVWDFRDKASGPVLLPRRQGDISVEISNDSRWLIAVSSSLSDKTAQLWELTAKGLASAPVILPIREEITKIGFSHIRPDSHWLIACSHDQSYRRTISLWNMRLDELVNLACRTAGRNLNDDEWKEYFPGEKAPKTCPEQ